MLNAPFSNRNAQQAICVNIRLAALWVTAWFSAARGTCLNACVRVCVCARLRPSNCVRWCIACDVYGLRWAYAPLWLASLTKGAESNSHVTPVWLGRSFLRHTLPLEVLACETYLHPYEILVCLDPDFGAGTCGAPIAKTGSLSEHKEAISLNRVVRILRVTRRVGHKSRLDWVTAAAPRTHSDKRTMGTQIRST